MSQQTQLPSRFKDARLSELKWSEKEGQYGKYHSINTEQDGGQWLLDYFKQADDKGYIYDLEGVYRYKRNNNWINRFKKSKTDRQLEAMALGQTVPASEGEAPATEPRFTQSAMERKSEWAERDQRKSEQIQKLHDETVAATNKNTESNFRVADEIASLRRQVEDLCFVLGEVSKELRAQGIGK